MGETYEKGEYGTKGGAEKCVAGEDRCGVGRVGDAQVIEHGRKEGHDADGEECRADDGSNPRNALSGRPAIPEQADWEGGRSKKGRWEDHLGLERRVGESRNEAVSHPYQEQRHRDEAADENT